MIFLGDIACPEEKIQSFVDCVNRINVFDNEIVIFNLEANILEPQEIERTLTLFNSPQIVQAFSKARKVIVSLANNHMYDYPALIQRTKHYLEQNNIGVFGICENDGLILPYEYEDRGRHYAFFGHCWRLYTRTNSNQENNTCVVDKPYDEFIEVVKNYILLKPLTKVYCFMHWNYDLEKWIMPMHRNISRDLIDLGVAGVVGCHSHCPQGAEFYKGKPIAYGLGNFYLPSNCYFNGKLVFPSFSKETYALKVNDDENRILWFNTDKNDEIVSFVQEESMRGPKISELSLFKTMSTEQYISFFKKHRSKKFLVPEYVEYSGVKYQIQERWAIFRVRVLRFILSILKR